MIKPGTGTSATALTTILLVLFLVLLTGCKANPKDFHSNGLSITLTSDFKERKMNEYTVYLIGSDVSFTAKEETNDSLIRNGYNISTLEDYCAALINMNGQRSSDVNRRGNYYYFVNEVTTDGTNYTYVNCMLKGSNSYWLCKFIVKADNYDKYKENIFAWADTITVE
ncbi:MAG: hypothetical protein IKO61_09720 [Lachnospiraceae bacterium]|nr:hypothetical protein [Lachnospiraceae bacterium]